LSTRLGALAVLCGIVSGAAYGGYSIYACVRDAFVVPTILSPTSDVVVATKLKLGELRVERVRAVAEMESLDADLAGSEKALVRLRDLSHTTGDAVQYTSAVNSRKTLEGTAELTALNQQRELLNSMLKTQQETLTQAKKDLAVGLISQADVERAQQVVNQTQLALLDNSRDQARGQSALNEANLSQAALSRESAPKSPELMHRQEQIIHVDLEMTRMEAERRAKTSQRDALTERIAQIDEMVQEIEERPLFQAVDKDLELAFVPYTQLAGVTPGAEVYSCVWGLFWCQKVGFVAELVPGEVVQADPWGSSTRGEYAVLDLSDHEAARAKTLRIRSWSKSSHGPTNAPPANGNPATVEARTSAR